MTVGERLSISLERYPVSLPSKMSMGGYDLTGKFHGSVILPDRKDSICGFRKMSLAIYKQILMKGFTRFDPEIQNLRSYMRVIGEIRNCLVNSGWQIKTKSEEYLVEDDEDGEQVFEDEKASSLFYLLPTKDNTKRFFKDYKFGI